MHEQPPLPPAGQGNPGLQPPATPTATLEQPPPAASPPPTASPPAPRRRWPKRAAVAAAVIVALFAGVGIGASANSHSGTVNTLQARVTTLHHNLVTTQGQLTSSQAAASSWQGKAQNATSVANSKAAAAYASRNAALASKAASLKRREHAVAAAEGQLQSSQISGDGVYVVGQDIKPGIYHSNGSGNPGANDCYYATLNSTNTSDISDNNNFDGAETVDLNGAYAFQTSGPCTWVQIG
jgi:hypothetical protein